VGVILWECPVTIAANLDLFQLEPIDAMLARPRFGAINLADMLMTRNQKIAESRVQLRKRLFPHVSEDHLWLRAKSTGFTTIPRALPLILTLMDRLSKGKPVSATYFELWCRMFDECFINLKPREMAFHAGFSGQRAEQTWAERMMILERLQFIETQEGPEGTHRGGGRSRLSICF
jgi:hypothetical protein